MIVGVGTNNTRSTIAATAALAAIPGVTAPCASSPTTCARGAASSPTSRRSPRPARCPSSPTTSRADRPPARARRPPPARRHPNITGVKQAAGAIEAGRCGPRRGAPGIRGARRRRPAPLPPLVLRRRRGDLRRGARLHPPLRRDDRVRARGQGRRGPGPPRRPAPGEPGLLRRAQPRGLQGRAPAQGRIPTPDVRLPLTNASPRGIEAALAAIAARLVARVKAPPGPGGDDGHVDDRAPADGVGLAHFSGYRPPDHPKASSGARAHRDRVDHIRARRGVDRYRRLRASRSEPVAGAASTTKSEIGKSQAPDNVPVPMASVTVHPAELLPFDRTTARISSAGGSSASCASACS